MNNLTTKLAAVCGGIISTGTVYAHDGHGLQGVHWHATDTGGFVAVAAMVAVAVWLSRK